MKTDEGEIKQLRSNLNYTLFDPPSDEIIGAWRDLYHYKNSDPCDPDPLSDREQVLYNILTERLISHLSMLGYTTCLEEQKLEL